MSFTWTPELLGRIRDYPHLIGHLVGKTKLSDLHSDWIKMIWDSPAGERFLDEPPRSLQDHSYH